MGYRAHEKRIAVTVHDNKEYAEQREKMGDEKFFEGATSMHSVDHRPSEAAKDRLAEMMQNADKNKKAFSRRRVRNEGEDVTYINERNRHFNKKIERAFNEYTMETRSNLERGTAL